MMAKQEDLRGIQDAELKDLIRDTISHLEVLTDRLENRVKESENAPRANPDGNN